MLAIKVLNKSEVKFKIMALGKGTASKSTTGTSMSKYDVEVEGRLKALEAAVAALQAQPSGGGGDCNQITDALKSAWPGKFANL